MSSRFLFAMFDHGSGILGTEIIYADFALFLNEKGKISTKFDSIKLKGLCHDLRAY